MPNHRPRGNEKRQENGVVGRFLGVFRFRTRSISERETHSFQKKQAGPTAILAAPGSGVGLFPSVQANHWLKNQPRTVPLKRRRQAPSCLSTLAFLVACRGPSLTLGGHCSRAGISTCHPDLRAPSTQKLAADRADKAME